MPTILNILNFNGNSRLIQFIYLNLKRKDVEIIIDNNNQVQIIGDKINLGKELLGAIVTGGTPSADNFPTHPFCFLSGAPILGSQNVKAKS